MNARFFDVARRAWVLAAAGCALALACGGDAFEGTRDPSSAGAGGDGPSTADPGGSSNGGSPGAAGASPHAGSAGEGGASTAGAPNSAPQIEIVQVSRTSLVGNVEASLTLARAPSAGNALIVGISCFSEIDNCMIPDGGVSDNHGNTYTLVIEGASIVSSDTHGTRPYLFIAEDISEPSGPFTISVDPNGAASENVQNLAWGVLEVAGLARHSADQTGATPNSCCEPTTTVSTEDPTTQANELAVAVHSARSNDEDRDFDYEPEQGWVQHHVNNDGVSQASQHSLVARVLTEAGIVSHTWTHEEPTRGTAAIIATFRGAAP